MSDFAIHLTADIIGEAYPLSSMTAPRAAAGGGREAIVDKSGSLAKLADKMNGGLRLQRTVSVKSNPGFYKFSAPGSFALPAP